MRDQRERYLRRQIALRRLLLKDGYLTADGRVLALVLKRLCYAAPNQTIIATDAHGAVDPVGTAARAARREVWDHLVNLLNTDVHEIVNLQEE